MTLSAPAIAGSRSGIRRCPACLELRNWDHRLLQTWKPFYVPVTDKCNLCTYGECDLVEWRQGFLRN